MSSALSEERLKLIKHIEKKKAYLYHLDRIKHMQIQNLEIRAMWFGI